MWDGYIRGEKPKKLYACLPCNTSGKWSLCRYAKSGEGYVTFLRDMQSRFHDIAYPPANSKTLAKAIDEFYYVNITLVIQLIEDRIEKQKKAQQQK